MIHLPFQILTTGIKIAWMRLEYEKISETEWTPATPNINTCRNLVYGTCGYQWEKYRLSQNIF